MLTKTKIKLINIDNQIKKIKEEQEWNYAKSVVETSNEIDKIAEIIGENKTQSNERFALIENKFIELEKKLELYEKAIKLLTQTSDILVKQKKEEKNDILLQHYNNLQDIASGNFEDEDLNINGN